MKNFLSLITSPDDTIQWELVAYLYKTLLVGCSVLFGYFGYRLFRLGIYEKQGELSAVYKGSGLTVRQFGPGLGFAVLAVLFAAIAMVRGVSVEHPQARQNPNLAHPGTEVPKLGEPASEITPAADFKSNSGDGPMPQVSDNSQNTLPTPTQYHETAKLDDGKQAVGGATPSGSYGIFGSCPGALHAGDRVPPNCGDYSTQDTWARLNGMQYICHAGMSCGYGCPATTPPKQSPTNKHQ